jgi:hypothetical protein
MSLIPFPNVPALPGVPALPRSPKFPPAIQAALGVVQGAIWRQFQIEKQWGIFDSKGKPLGDANNFVALESLGLGATLSTGAIEFSKESRVSDFPVERGGFASYNKVEMPASPVVTLCFGGTEADRSAFLAAIDLASKSTDLYDVVTPEVTYAGYSVERYNYQRRSSKGATLLVLEVTLKEVRQVSAQHSQIAVPQDDGATPPVDGGKVQGKTPDTSTLKSLWDKTTSPAMRDTIYNYLSGMVK